MDMQKLEALDYWSIFAGVENQQIAHDAKNILTSIYGFTQLMDMNTQVMNRFPSWGTVQTFPPSLN